MHVTVLGGGNGGIASAFDFAQHGHEVALYAPAAYGAHVADVAAAGGIRATGDLEGFARWRDGRGAQTARFRSRSLTVAASNAALNELRALLGDERVKLVRGG